ncbi:MAG: AAA family ATPase [Haliscomenobacter sp.]|nr:AAA family ATPase [Haliscomenobacter sp.]MBK8879204.1 AAA family ATPase [Haliscomenobacter sp.]
MSLDKQPLELSGDFRFALDVLEKEQKNLFITGRAGTGKSTLLQLFRNTTRKNTVVLAPTGVSALNVRGQTIHSFFGFPPRMFPKSEIKKRRDRRLYRKLELLIIDEISMVRADLLDHIDYFLRINRDSPLPFGGVQVVFFGDLFQLPPIVSQDQEAWVYHSLYATPYFFSADILRHGFSMEALELKKVYRQTDRRFLRLLDSIRLNVADRDDLDELNDRVIPNFEPEDFYITLTARNATADQINLKELAKIDAKEHVLPGKVSGEFNPNLFPTDLALRLKPLAQVMLLKNDPDKRFVNGTIGKILRVEPDKLRIQIEDGQGNESELDIEPATWEVLRYKTSPDNPDQIESEVMGTFTQFPVKLAWAVTIHKAQGKTFDKVIIDLGKGAFEHGQTYVALSRCRSLEGVVLRRPIRPQDIMTDERVVEFHQLLFG